MSKFVVAVDVGATNLRASIFTLDGGQLKTLTVRTPTEGHRDTIAELIYELVIKLVDDLGLSLKELQGIGVGSIGPLNIRAGEVVNTPNLPIKNFRLRKPLIELFNTSRVYVVNDCVAAVWGERNFGLGIGVSNLVYLTISTGVGAGVIVDGNLLLGKDGNAHEVGHLVVRYDGIRCGCGGIGHWEAYVSGNAIPKYVRYYVSTVGYRRRSRVSELLDHGDVSPEEFFKLVRDGDELAVEICNTLCVINAAGLASVINAYDPELISVGGSVALNNYDLIIEPSTKYLSNYVINRVPRIAPTAFGKDSVLVGAASLVINPPKELLRIYGESA